MGEQRGKENGSMGKRERERKERTSISSSERLRVSGNMSQKCFRGGERQGSEPVGGRREGRDEARRAHEGAREAEDAEDKVGFPGDVAEGGRREISD